MAADGTISLFNKEPFFRARDSIGAGSARTPFVDLFIGNHRLSLQGGRPNSEGRDVIRSEVPEATAFPLYLVDFRYATRNATGASQEVTLTVLDPNWDYLESLIASNVRARQSFSFNFGWRGIHDRTGSVPIQFVMKNFTVSYLPFQGAKISLQGLDAAVALSFARLTGAFFPTRRIDDVIKGVIESVDPNFEVEIDPIEQTIGAENNRLENRTAAEYVYHLLKIAKGSGLGGSSNYIIRTERGSTPGKTKILIKTDIPRKHVIRNYVVGREREGTMFEFSPSAVGSVVLSMGGGKASGASVDPKTKKVIKVTSTHLDDLPRTGDVTVNEVPKEDVSFTELPFSDLADVQGFTKGAREEIDSHQYYATAVVLGDPGLTPQQQIHVKVLKSNAPGAETDAVTDRSVVHTSGVYRIEEAEHIISAGMFRTNLNLHRESGFFGAGEKGARLEILLDAGVPNTVGVRAQNLDSFA